MTATRLSGLDAIAYAEARCLKLAKYEDPTEGAREGLTVEEARAVAREDASLVYLDVGDGVATLVGREDWDGTPDTSSPQDGLRMWLRSGKFGVAELVSDDGEVEEYVVVTEDGETVHSGIYATALDAADHAERLAFRER